MNEEKIIAKHYGLRLYDLSEDHGRTWMDRWLYDYEANQYAAECFVVRDHERMYIIGSNMYGG